QLGSALDSYKAAQKQAGQSLDCLHAIQRVQMKMESYKDAAATGAKMALLVLYGRILAAQHQDDEARREFTACAAVAGTSPAECARARRLSSNIDSARNEPVPPFELKTIDGETVSRDSLAGKVVLVDFWATWCPA